MQHILATGTYLDSSTCSTLVGSAPPFALWVVRMATAVSLEVFGSLGEAGEALSSGLPPPTMCRRLCLFRLYKKHGRRGIAPCGADMRGTRRHRVIFCHCPSGHVTLMTCAMVVNLKTRRRHWFLRNASDLYCTVTASHGRVVAVVPRRHPRTSKLVRSRITATITHHATDRVLYGDAHGQLISVDEPG